ncbi:MAG: 3-oxoacyl-[acyl-carrier-protein] synthase [Myxococcales bacterium]|nr:3-oxoacyl-[acyl-carrier-protein] synthase [Myxococcales bacterium]
MTTHDLELYAARDALERARVQPCDIDLLLTHTVAPEYLLSNSAALLHHGLKLNTECFAMQAEAAAYTFLMQLTIAEAMIVSGRARCALLVQSCGASRLVENDNEVSPYFGDGATAVVVGNVASRGLLSSVHYADGQHPNTLIASVPRSTWYAEGRPLIHIGDAAGMRAVLLQTVDLCTKSVTAALAKAGCEPSAIRFFSIHQGTPWLRQIAQESSGLETAASVETFSETGYLFSAIIPLGLRKAEDEGILKPGDLITLFGGGTGMTYGATVLEWGR